MIYNIIQHPGLQGAAQLQNHFKAGVSMAAIQKKSTTQLTIEHLQKYLKDDAVQVGDRFPTERKLCTDLGIGRGTVREAVKVLVSQGYLVIRPGLGTFIQSKTPVQKDPLTDYFVSNEVALQDLIVVRSALEPLATKMALEQCTPDQLVLLKKNLAASEKAAAQRNSADLAKLDEEFHRSIFLIAGNALMLEINSMINTHLAQFRQNTFKIKNNVDNFIPAHAAIIRAFESGDALMGEKKMRQHMKKVAKDLETSKYHT